MDPEILLYSLTRENTPETPLLTLDSGLEDFTVNSLMVTLELIEAFLISTSECSL